LFTAFGILNSDGQPAPEEFDFALDVATTDVRGKCHAVTRFMKRNAKLPIPSDALVWCFAGDLFFDAMISHPNVKQAFEGTNEAIKRIGGDYALGTSLFVFGGIVFENYQGSDDNGTIAIASDEARFMFSGVPGIYAEYYAPADFLDTVNTKGLPRYARLAPDRKFNKSVELHTQQNPLPLCLRPKTLCKGLLSN
jgi:hypothetical protein